jgi:serine/threonine protein kinase
MVDYQQNEGKIVIEQVQITDLENAAHLPSGKAVKGMLAGNENWRSPEAFYRGRLSKPTDIYSFGVVVSNLLMITYSMPIN